MDVGMLSVIGIIIGIAIIYYGIRVFVPNNWRGHPDESEEGKEHLIENTEIPGQRTNVSSPPARV